MPASVMRGGERGERERFALEHNLALIGWEGFPDLSTIHSRESLARLMARERPNFPPGTARIYAQHLWWFSCAMAVDDLLVMPLKGQSVVAVGVVTGGYQYRPELPPLAQHCRPAEWRRHHVPRAEVGACVPLNRPQTTYPVRDPRVEEFLRKLIQ